MDEQMWRTMQQQLDMIRSATDTYTRYFKRDPVLQRILHDQTTQAQWLQSYMANMTEFVADMARRQEMLTRTIGYYTQVIPAISAHYRDISPLWAQSLTWLKSKRVQEAFAAYGLIPSPSMTQELIDEVVTAYAHNADADEVCAKVVAYYNADNCAALAGLVSDLCASTELTEWDGVLQETLAAHRAGLDRITTQALVPIIEDITMPVLAMWEWEFGQIKPKERLTHNRIPTTLEKYVGHLPSRMVYAVGVAMIKCTIAYMQNYVYLQCWPDTDKAIRTNTTQVQRHSLVHGWSKSGTRLNTIRCILILDCLRLLMPVLRAAYGADEETPQET